jgi:Tol biopolymer transport system component
LVALTNHPDVWLLPFPSGTPRKLISGSSFRNVVVGWFPDGRSFLTTERKDDFTSNLIRVGIDGSRRTVYSGTANVATSTSSANALSPDGNRLAFVAGNPEWNVLEVSIPSGVSRTIVGGGGIAIWPDWAPSGTHFLFSTARTGSSPTVVDREAVEGGFSRRLLEEDTNQTRWSPDGRRIAFFAGFLAGGGLRQLKLANASGGGMVVLDSTPGLLQGASWSPDGQWISYLRNDSSGWKVVKIRASPGSSPEILANAEGWQSSVAEWSPSGDWILYPAADGLDLISPEGKSGHLLTSRKFMAYGFSKDGGTVYGVLDHPGAGARWQLYSVNVRTGTEKLLAAIDLPQSTGRLAGFSLHPDGKRFLTSVANFPFHIWMMEGFNKAPDTNWLSRLLRR